MLNAQWYELRPYRTDSDTSGEDNMMRVLDHVREFLMAVIKEGSTTRIFLRAEEANRATLLALEGTEVLASPGPDLAGFASYSSYSTARHCAEVITPKQMEPISMYGTLANQTSDSAFFALHARKSQNPQPVRQYISTLERGQDPSSAMRFLSKATKTVSGAKRDRIASAREKLGTRNIFVCRLVSGAMNPDDGSVIGGGFPSGAFRRKRVSEKRAMADMHGRCGIPFLGASRVPILADFEIMSFLSFPSNHDTMTVEFDVGRMASKSSGLGEGEIS